MDAADKRLQELNRRELENSKKGRVVIIYDRLWNIPKDHIILYRKYEFLGEHLILPVAVGKLKESEKGSKKKNMQK
ncbi:hypothetical protein KKE06_02325 [Candidatus Micrarchaeota archaeon]|nr:hypothetical protein [Candidatus Micrarchaeota archaeon]MBU1930859.1 hypothetical protein [Candidatus Micrarchaeota archaeon]